MGQLYADIGIRQTCCSSALCDNYGTVNATPALQTSCRALTSYRHGAFDDRARDTGDATRATVFDIFLRVRPGSERVLALPGVSSVSDRLDVD
jgi:hypothetical protein